MKYSYRSGFNKGIGFGIVLLIVGFVFLGNNFGIIPLAIKNVIISWQMLLIFIGVVNLFKRQFVSGVVLIFIGSFFIIPKVVSGIDGNFIHIYWPLLLIGAGIFILLKRLIFPKSRFETLGNEWKERGFAMRDEFRQRNYQSNNESANGGFSKNSIFAGTEHIVLDPEFNGGELNAVFGGLTLDLRRTNLPVGETRLDVNAVFGGITIFIPSDWFVETHLDAVFGGFQDNRLPKDVLDKSRKLVITGSCVFGGGEIRN